jgi:hypothetical protein
VIEWDNAGHAQGLHHFLAVEGGEDGPAYRTLFDGSVEVDSTIRRVTPMLARVIDVDIPGVAVMGHLYSLGASTTPGSDNQTPEIAT